MGANRFQREELSPVTYHLYEAQGTWVQGRIGDKERVKNKVAISFGASAASEFSRVFQRTGKRGHGGLRRVSDG